MKIAFEKYGGMLPGVAPHLLPAYAAQVATDTKLVSGALKPWRVPLNVATLGKDGTIQGLFFYEGAYWFHWLNPVKAVKGPLATDPWKRVYYCDSGPKMTANDVALAGTDYPAASYALGVPQPSSTPNAAALVASTNSRVEISALNVVAGDLVATSVGHGLTIDATVQATFGNSLLGVLDGATVYIKALTVDTFQILLDTFINKTISRITKANPAVVTCNGHGLVTGDEVLLSVNGMRELHNWTGSITVLTTNTFSLDDVNSSTYGTFTSGDMLLVQRTLAERQITLSAITNAKPAKVTSAAHNLQSGAVVTFDVLGMTQLDAVETAVTRVDANTFTLPDIDSRYYDAFTSGTATVLPAWWQLVDEESEAVATDAEMRVYVYTFITKYGEEGVPSVPSESLFVLPGQDVLLSGMALAPEGNTAITHKRIYRTNQGSDDTAYQLVATVDISVTEYRDSIASDSLSIVLESAEYNEPPSDLDGLTALPNGCLCGYRGTELCFSEPYKPHAWPLAYRIPMEDPIVSIGAFSNMILVTTTGLPSLVVGDTPGAMSRDKLEIGQSCVAARGMVDMGYSLLYPGPDGLISVGKGNFELATGKIMSKDEWKAYNPSSIHAYLYAGKYLAFYNNGSPGAFLFDPSGEMIVNLSLTASGAYTDPATGELYLIQSQAVMKFDAGLTYTSYVWKSRPFLTHPVNLGAARIVADSYPLTMKVYADGTLIHTQTVASAEPFRLPGGYLARKWEVQLEGTATVNLVLLANMIEEL